MFYTSRETNMLPRFKFQSETMAKKITPKPVANPAPVAKSSPLKATAKKAAPPKKAASIPAKNPAVAPQTISNDDIALRAYFIAEKRQQHGLRGDSAQDWLDAEKQLRAELKKKSVGSKPATRSVSRPPASHSMGE